MESLGLGHVAEQMVDMVEEAWDMKFEEVSCQLWLRGGSCSCLAVSGFRG